MNPVTGYATGGYTGPRFKVGDKVRRTRGHFGNIKPGDTGVVRLLGHGNDIKLEGHDETFMGSMFELVEAAKPALTAEAQNRAEGDWRHAVAIGSTTVSLEEWSKADAYQTPVEPELPDGIYAAATYRDRPQYSILWRHKGDLWQPIVTPYDGVYSAHRAHPRDHFIWTADGKWWEQIVRLTPED